MISYTLVIPAKPKNIELNFKASQITQDIENEQDSMDKTVKINFSIANKISMFENKHANQNQSSEFSTSKKGAISNTFVGRAKLKFGKQHPESEQSNKITTKASNRQKALQNGTKVKESSSDTKIKSEGRIQSSSIINEEVGKLAGSQLNQNGKVEDNQANVFTPKKMEADLAKDNHLPKTTPIQLSEETETSQNSNSGMNARSRSPESGGKQRVGIDICSPRTEDKDKSLIQSDPVPGISELKCDMTPQIENKDKSMTNAVLEDGQVFEQNISGLEDLNSSCDVLKAGNSDVICDSPSDMAKFTETLKNLDSSICIPQKKKKPKLPKSPAPHFAMPPIHEDHLEKIFDPNIFTVGLGIKRDRAQDLAPSLQLKLQSLEIEAKVKPKRASTENSLIFQSLKSSNRGYPILTQEKSGEESKDSTDGNIKRSRIESSPIFLSLLTPTANENVFRPSATSVNAITTSFASQVTADSSGTPPVIVDTAQKSESISEFKAPSYMQTDDAKKEGILQMPNFGNLDLSFSSWLKSGQHEANSFVDTEDYRICQIDLFTEPNGLGVASSYFDDTEETRFGSAPKTCSIRVHWGIWLLYEESGFQGIPLLLEPGEYPDLSFWEKKEAYIRSMRPLKMGGRKVECPECPKVIIYEKPFFEGKHIELDSELHSLAEEGQQKEESTDLKSDLLTSIGSIKVKGGVWVAYEKPEFAGHQYLLEEGEYQEWTDWGGYDEQVQSLRPVLGSLMQPHMIMYTEKDFGTKGSNVNVLGIISNLKDTGYGVRTQSINVLGGIWVAYENPDFTGEQYILDKGMYPSYEAWGATGPKISSVQPLILDDIGDHLAKFKVQLFSEPKFQGSCLVLEEDISQIEETFLAKSSKVLSGSWIAYDKENFSGNQYVLEEGAYPDLSAVGCLPQTCLKSLQVVNIELSEPLIVLYEKRNFEGKKMEFTTEILNLQFLGYNPHVASVEICGGIWIIYEHNNYKGRQILLTPKKIPNWYDLSGYHKIGSLRPLLQWRAGHVPMEQSSGNQDLGSCTEKLKSTRDTVEPCGTLRQNRHRAAQHLLEAAQKQVYFRLRNKETGQFMSTDGNVDDLNLLRIKVADDTKSDEQVWVYQDGFIKSRLVEDFCLTIVGNLITPGAKLGLALQQNEEKQIWSIKPDGRIFSKMKPHLILDIKGGKHYDQNHLIVNSVNEDKLTQYWEPLVI
ncbi:Beta/gamma crystallin domain-containing protein 1 [Varanus komodoensis]|nr:Beta/gamma crystallin domain-containing protein 1 [Varanus komodoensis]